MDDGVARSDKGNVRLTFSVHRIFSFLPQIYDRSLLRPSRSSLLLFGACLFLFVAPDDAITIKGGCGGEEEEEGGGGGGGGGEGRVMPLVSDY